MSYTIIVAKYNEDIEWTKRLNNIVIYNKGNDETGIPLKNIGREGETFLHYIINHYDNLPDYVLLLQGNPFDHMFDITPLNFQEKIDTLIKESPDDIQSLFYYILHETRGTYPYILTREYYSFFFEGPVPPTCEFSPGCQYIIPKKNILSRPIQFYIKIHAMLINSNIITQHDSCFLYKEFDPDSIDGWCLERMFFYIFSNNTLLSSTIMKCINV